MTNHAGRPPRTFHAGALALVLPALPLLLAWTSGYYGTPPPGVSPFALGAHWVCGWLVPLTASAVLAYGTACTRIDPRLAAAAARDLRRLWWSQQALPLAATLVMASTLITGMIMNTGEGPLALAVPAVAGLTVSVCAVHLVVARFGCPPGLACALALTASAVVLVGPYLTPGLAVVAVDSTLANWMNGDPSPGPTPALGTILWPVAALAALAAGHLLPRDSAGLTWVTNGAREHD